MNYNLTDKLKAQLESPEYMPMPYDSIQLATYGNLPNDMLTSKFEETILPGDPDFHDY